MPPPVIDILMYHSISNRGGATSITPEVFLSQVDALAQSGLPVITMDDLLAARRGGPALPDRSIILTFDDGFRDFLDTAWPVLSRHGFRPIVYLPTAHVGRAERWAGGAEPPRALMSWAEIRALAAEGVLFGSHTVSHADLDLLDGDASMAELIVSRRKLEDILDRPVRHFAPPYGRAGPEVRSQIAQVYETSVGTRLGQATAKSDPFDLPRIEMFYFTDLSRWRDWLAGKGKAYLVLRRGLRAIRHAVLHPSGANPRRTPS
ncbi:peptidoglycan/xylan/chitin deacetylase (PgdA/CDA1 family) [Albidovulum inexpectatum]|uniref:Chitooligosaccharide deacetylase n=1 Tax=Albidovulum inexpectatum TaxID=196587 RepID=A0A2S5JDG6_9RHOB|nr:polysaccharide deacetylase family protein [Albidovulum inexpectatum]PPB79513.1 peptidoglycan/xylan/chitin deacetylase (PgdA/CDA1 family) [Albidovulum inexpectatum]